MLHRLSLELDSEASEMSSISSISPDDLISELAMEPQQMPWTYTPQINMPFYHQPDPWMIPPRPANDRVYSTPSYPMSSQHHMSLYHKQISEWAMGQKTVQRAAGKHAR